MPRFPADAPIRRVVKTLEVLGFTVVREKEHISMVRENPDRTKTYAKSPEDKGLHAPNDLHSGRYLKRRILESL